MPETSNLIIALFLIPSISQSHIHTQVHATHARVRVQGENKLRVSVSDTAMQLTHGQTSNLTTYVL